MECPYCKKEMAKGKIPAARGSVCWCPADKDMWSFSYFDDDVVMLAKAGLTSAEAEAYYCADCGMVFAPVPEKVEGTIDKLKKKLTDISEKREAAAEERKIRQEEERREKEREKRAKKDPWER